MNPLSTNAKKLLKRIETQAVSPFQEELSKALSAGPTEASIKKFANKHPDKWAQMLIMLGKMSGYSEKSEHTVNNNIFVKIANCSDAELKLLEEQASEELKTLESTVIAEQ